MSVMLPTGFGKTFGYACLLFTGCVTSLQSTSFQTTMDVIEDVTEGESNILTCFITFHGIV